jgi:nicotinic acid phosphoribosyltransferase
MALFYYQAVLDRDANNILALSRLADVFKALKFTSNETAVLFKLVGVNILSPHLSHIVYETHGSFY